MPPRPAALQPNVRLFTIIPPEDRPPEAGRPVIPMATAGLGGHSLHRKQDLWKLLPSHWTSSAKYTVFWHTPHFLPPPQFGILEVDTEKGMNFPGRQRPGWPRTGPGAEVSPDSNLGAPHPRAHRGTLRSHSIFSPLPSPLGHKLEQDTGWCRNNNKPFAVCIHMVNLTAKEAGELELIKHKLSVLGLKQAKLILSREEHMCGRATKKDKGEYQRLLS